MMVAAGFGICFIPEFWPIIPGVLTLLVADPGKSSAKSRWCRSPAGVSRRGSPPSRARSGGIGGRRRRRRWPEPSAAVKLRARWRLVPAAPPSPILRYAAQARRMKDWADAGEWPSSPWGPHPAPHTPSVSRPPGWARKRWIAPQIVQLRRAPLRVSWSRTDLCAHGDTPNRALSESSLSTHWNGTSNGDTAARPTKIQPACRISADLQIIRSQASNSMLRADPTTP
jgi:hypothetical protein